MKPLFWAACVGVAVAGVTASPPAQPEAVVVFTGDINGYLAPCGCSKPQIGGILRLAGVVRALKQSENTYYVDLGNWTKPPHDRQAELKAEAMAEIFANLKADYLNVSVNDARLGGGYIRTIAGQTSGSFDSANLHLPELQNRIGRQLGPLWVQGVVSDEQARRISPDALSAQDVFGLPAPGARVLLFSGTGQQAERLAAESPPGALIVHSQGDPLRQARRVGNAVLVSPGDRGRFVGKIELVNGRWTNYTLIELGPEHEDDAFAAATYKAYLRRVADEDLLGKLVRTSGSVNFVGSDACAPCHTREYEIWKASAHARAMPTLEETGNYRDPECVGCHVVGLSDTSGFRDMRSTPHLANVGCESCHGPGGDHVKQPKLPYGKAGEKSCMSCHVPDHSPGFDFGMYWERIKH